MARHFSANQYENAFKPPRLGNWEDAKVFKGEPKTLGGYTKIIGNGRGHLLENVTRSKNNPWGNYMGTWDLPKKIAGNSATNDTGRTSLAQQKLADESRTAQQVLSGKTKNQDRLRRLPSGARPAAPAPPLVNGAPVSYDAPVSTQPIEVMCDEVAPGRSPSPPTRSPLVPNPAMIDADDKPLFRSNDL